MVDHEAINRLSKVVANKVFRAAAASGAISVEGRTREELLQDLIDLVEGTPAESSLWEITIEHRSSLIQEARRYRDQDQPFFACLMYATWIEHWINGVIIDLASRKGIDDGSKISIIRESNIRAKLGWLPKVLGAPEFEEAHRNTALKVIESRNGFVHYKYKAHEESSRTELVTLIGQFDETVSYFEQYYVTNFLSGLNSLDDLGD